MKTLYKPLFILLAIFSLSSCGSKEEKANNEMISIMNEMADTYDKIADGSLEGDAAITKIKEINTKKQKITEKYADLKNKEIPEEDAKKYAEKMNPASTRLTESLKKATLSGKLTPEMIKAMSDTQTK